MIMTSSTIPPDDEYATTHPMRGHRAAFPAPWSMSTTSAAALDLANLRGADNVAQGTRVHIEERGQTVPRVGPVECWSVRRIEWLSRRTAVRYLRGGRPGRGGSPRQGV
jgi:hypothetical protein